jgi:hypothetical protein
MRLRRHRAGLSALAVVCAGVAWLLIGWVIGTTDAGRPPVRDAAPASIEAADVLAVIVSDRPTTAKRHERSTNLRSLPSLVDAASGTALPGILTRDMGFPASLLTVGPLSFGLARRGPPPAIRR